MLCSGAACGHVPVEERDEAGVIVGLKTVLDISVNKTNIVREGLQKNIQTLGFDKFLNFG